MTSNIYQAYWDAHARNVGPRQAVTGLSEHDYRELYLDLFRQIARKRKQTPTSPAETIFTCHPNGGYFLANREDLMKDFYDGYAAKIFVYKFSHVEIITKKTEISIKKP